MAPKAKKKSPEGGKKTGKSRRASQMSPEAETLLAEALDRVKAGQGALPTMHVEIDTSQGHLGVTLSNHPLGVLIQNADEVDLAYQSGLRPGDVLTAVDGTKVVDHAGAASLMFVPGTHDITYVPAKAADDELISRRRPTEFVAIELGEEQHMGLTLSDHPLGVLVDGAYEADLAYKAGMRVGDVIVTLNGQAVIWHRTAVELINLAREDFDGEIRMTYLSAEAAAVELVMTSSYGPRGSDVPGKILSTTASTHTTTPVPRPARAPLPSQRNRPPSLTLPPQPTPLDGKVGSMPLPSDRGYDFVYSSSTTSSSNPASAGNSRRSPKDAETTPASPNALKTLGSTPPSALTAKLNQMKLEALEEDEDAEADQQQWLGLDEEDSAAAAADQAAKAAEDAAFKAAEAAADAAAAELAANAAAQSEEAALSAAASAKVTGAPKTPTPPPPEPELESEVPSFKQLPLPPKGMAVAALPALQDRVEL